MDRKGLRPTASRVKSAIFSIVESLEWKRSGAPNFDGWNVLDLFAGTGSLGFEILSRGAGSCVFVEMDRSTGQLLKENAASLGCENCCDILIQSVDKADWEKFGPFHLVFLDPPYAIGGWDKIMQSLSQSPALMHGCIIVIEHDPKITLPGSKELTIHSQRVLGPAGISVFVRE